MNIAKSFWGHHVNVYYVMAIPQICDTCIAKNRSKSEILYLCLNIPKNWVRRITKHDTACEQALSGTLVAGWENECPTQACSRLNIILLSQNRLQVSLFEQRGGGGGRHLNTSFLPSIEILTMNYFAPAVVFYLQKGIFYQIWTIFHPQGLGIWPRNCEKIQMPHLGCCKWK